MKPLFFLILQIFIEFYFLDIYTLLEKLGKLYFSNCLNKRVVSLRDFKKYWKTRTRIFNDTA